MRDLVEKALFTHRIPPKQWSSHAQIGHLPGTCGAAIWRYCPRLTLSNMHPATVEVMIASPLLTARIARTISV
jgi:hypothetical protein